MQGMQMLIKEQLFTYCTKEYRSAKLPNLAAYKQFLTYYYQHFIESESGIEDMGYFSQAAMHHFQQVLKYRGKTVVAINKVQLQKQYTQSLTRVQLSFPDTPFLVESLRSLFNRLGYKIQQSNLMANYLVEVGASKVSISPSAEKGDTFAWFDLEAVGGMEVADLKKAIDDTISDVSICVKDWRRMQDTLRNVMYSWRDTPAEVAPPEIVQSYVAFMEWILSSFAFLGYHGYKVTGKKYTLLGERWGLSAKKDAMRYKTCKGAIVQFPAQVQEETHPLILITQTEDISTVHRAVHKDLIVLRVYKPDNGVSLIEEHYFSGLLTADAYVSDPSKIPLISQKFQEAMLAHGLRSRYSLRRMGYILKSLPREEIFQTDMKSLSQLAYDIFMIQERPVVRSFIRRDVCGKYYSVMVYIPRQMLTTRLRVKIEELLRSALDAHDVSYTPFFAESVLTRLHFVLRCHEDSVPLKTNQQIQEALHEICESKEENLYGVLSGKLGHKAGYKTAGNYIDSLSDTYWSTYDAETLASDIEMLEGLNEHESVKVQFVAHDNNQISCRLYQLSDLHSLSLTKVFPVLTNLGFVVNSERHFEEQVGNKQFHVSEYSCVIADNVDTNLSLIKEPLEKAMVGMLTNQGTSDKFGSLMIRGGLKSQEIEVVRALCAYLGQIDFPLSQARIMAFCTEHYKFSQYIIRLFNVKFQPKLLKREILYKRYFKEAMKYTELVSTGDEERIIQALLNIIDAVVRTNYHIPNREALVLKVASSEVMGMPKPSPMFEFFVYSHRFMGVHLRFSKTARGGIRNSDRQEDVRHEVFELAKTQRLKNTLIVPDGAKGGFVCRNLAGLSHEESSQEVLACYKVFIRAMLSVTDNVVNNKTAHHASLVIYDEQDPYFVVAADKGTATFSPYANAIALEAGYWLGDAFASGGQYGYDHKKMGITAKGAWESVKWHFASMKRSVYTDPFTAAGIGDMSGDVFGNGMLLSDQIRLVAAFGYARIFIDPNPDPKVSYAERLRLFHLPRSTWEDYNPALISPGGGVFLRSAKTIDLTPQMKKMFSTSKSKMEPNELIQEILKLQVDLLWNGGIGVYVKSSKETHADVMDFHNDHCRVDAKDLKAAVIGEGGNNGFTQLARVEYAQNGGRINTDFIDNSAGVNTSDVEVNFKILFQSLIAKKKLSLPKRNALLTRMTHKVSEMVLRNNFLQNVLIDLAILESKHTPNQYIRMVDFFESTGLLKRDIEKIPSKRELQNRAKQQNVFTRPEMAVLLSYSKIDLISGIGSLALSKSKMTDTFLLNYFPELLTKSYKADIGQHLLRNELVVTELANTMLSEVGMLFVTQISDECNTDLGEVVQAYLIVREVLGLKDIYESLYHNADKLQQETLLYLLGSIQRAIYKSCRWLIRYRDLTKPEKCLKEFEGLSASIGVIDFLPKKYVHRMLKIEQELKAAGVKKSAIELICESRYFYQLFGVYAVSQKLDVNIDSTKHVYYQIAHLLKFHKLKEKLGLLQVSSRWEVIQRSQIDDDLGQMLEELTRVVIAHGQLRKCSYHQALEKWTKDHQDTYMEIRRSLNEITELRKTDLSVFVVVLARIQAVLEGF